MAEHHPPPLPNNAEEQQPHLGAQQAGAYQPPAWNYGQQQQQQWSGAYSQQQYGAQQGTQQPVSVETEWQIKARLWMEQKEAAERAAEEERKRQEEERKRLEEEAKLRGENAGPESAPEDGTQDMAIEGGENTNQVPNPDVNLNQLPNPDANQFQQYGWYQQGQQQPMNDQSQYWTNTQGGQNQGFANQGQGFVNQGQGFPANQTATQAFPDQSQGFPNQGLAFTNQGQPQSFPAQMQQDFAYPQAYQQPNFPQQSNIGYDASAYQGYGMESYANQGLHFGALQNAPPFAGQQFQAAHFPAPAAHFTNGGFPLGPGMPFIHPPTVQLDGGAGSPGAGRPKKAAVPSWLLEELRKKQAKAAGESEGRGGLSQEKVTGPRIDGRRSLSPSDAEDSDDEKEAEAARKAAINVEIRRVLTEVLLKVTDDMLAEIVTQVVNEDDSEVEDDGEAVEVSEDAVAPVRVVVTKGEATQAAPPLPNSKSQESDEDSDSDEGENLLGLAYDTDEEEERRKQKEERALKRKERRAQAQEAEKTAVAEIEKEREEESEKMAATNDVAGPEKEGMEGIEAPETEGDPPDEAEAQLDELGEAMDIPVVSSATVIEAEPDIDTRPADLEADATGLELPSSAERNKPEEDVSGDAVPTVDDGNNLKGRDIEDKPEIAEEAVPVEQKEQEATDRSKKHREEKDERREKKDYKERRRESRDEKRSSRRERSKDEVEKHRERRRSRERHRSRERRHRDRSEERDKKRERHHSERERDEDAGRKDREEEKRDERRRDDSRREHRRERDGGSEHRSSKRDPEGKARDRSPEAKASRRRSQSPSRSKRSRSPVKERSKSKDRKSRRHASPRAERHTSPQEKSRRRRLRCEKSLLAS